MVIYLFGAVTKDERHVLMLLAEMAPNFQLMIDASFRI